MKPFIRQFVILLALSGVLLLTACSSSGGGYGSGGYGVYDDYGYPYRGYGYGGCCYDDDDHHHDRPDRPNRGEGTSFQTRPGTSLTRPGPSGGGMGRPARMSRGGGGLRGGGRGR
jgi:hypothetical protein